MKIAFRIFYVGLLLLLQIMVSAPAGAGISEFNSAMGRGDYKAAAAETLNVWESYDKSKPSAITIAREFAFVNYLAVQYDQAKIFIHHLTDSDSPLGSKDDQPVVTQILSNLIDYREDSSDLHREQLELSLTERLELQGFDSISLVAAEALYTEYWARSDLTNAKNSAALASKLLGRAGDAAVARKRKAELVTGVSGFLLHREDSSYDYLVNLHDDIVVDVDAVEDSNQREMLISLKWVVHAWVNSVEAYFTSYYAQTGSIIDRNIKPRRLRNSNRGYFYEDSQFLDSRPFCEVDFDDGKLRYPSSEAFKGTVGSVIVKVDFDEKGKASNPSVLAAIPAEAFSENVLKAAPTFRIKAKKGQDLDVCRINRKDAVIPITFIIQ